jgi:hypothetical protein
MRANGENGTFVVIGTLNKPGKGVQKYNDTRPMPGKNCYKVAIEFTSGLKWMGNSECMTLNNFPRESDRPKTIAGATQPNAPLPSSDAAGSNNTARPAIKLPEVKEEFIEQPDFIKSRYIYTDAVTSNLNLVLPADVYTHNYAIRFLDNKNHVITEVPKINAHKIIFDRLNFTGYSTIRYLLKKDGVEIESGYLSLRL